MLGLLYNEIGDAVKAMSYLEKAITKQPPNMNAFYNYGLMLQQQNKFEKSIEVAKKGLALSQNNERLLYVQLLGEVNIKSSNAINTCSILLQIDPNNQNYVQIMGSLQNK